MVWETYGVCVLFLTISGLSDPANLSAQLPEKSFHINIDTISPVSAFHKKRIVVYWFAISFRQKKSVKILLS